ncbi:MAG: heme exporter protein CcmD [Pseudomonadota bacterium]
MPDLGEYASEVLSAYAVTLTLLAILIWLSWRRYARVKAALEEVERNG